jgi:hypothetical protein
MGMEVVRMEMGAVENGIREGDGRYDGKGRVVCCRLVSCREQISTASHQSISSSFSSSFL